MSTRGRLVALAAAAMIAGCAHLSDGGMKDKGEAFLPVGSSRVLIDSARALSGTYATAAADGCYGTSLREGILNASHAERRPEPVARDGPSR